MSERVDCPKCGGAARQLVGSAWATCHSPGCKKHFRVEPPSPAPAATGTGDPALPRYVVIHDSDAWKRKLHGAEETDPLGRSWWGLWECDDAGNPTRLVGTDGGEPEDQLLVRDWKWVPEELNSVAAALASLLSEIEALAVEWDKEADAFHRAEDIANGYQQGAGDRLRTAWSVTEAAAAALRTLLAKHRGTT